MSTLEILSALVDRLNGTKLSKLGVIPWASPVPSFGDLSQSRIATLGLNPSNREFVDLAGKELTGPHRRFHTLRSLGIRRWSEATDEHLRLILESCNDYFTGNPYDGWFRALDKLILGTNLSYYGMFSGACHLDLVPYATASKWTELTTTERTGLLSSAGDALGMLLSESQIELLVLNGQSVIENFQFIAGIEFQRQAIPAWTLPRRDTPGVRGYAYSGQVHQVSGIDLGREVAVLGFSHNIQSSFGVTTKVKTSIQEWIAHSANGAFC